MTEPMRSTLATYWTQIGALDRSRAESAWQWFIERYRPFVRDVLVRLVGGADADAATSDFWTFLFESGVLQRADRNRRLRAFLVGVLRNFARQWLRDRARATTSMQSVAGEVQEPAVADLHEQEEMTLWAGNVLHNALAEMEQRWPNSALVLRCFYGLPDRDGRSQESLSVTATATRLECKVNAVHQALHRGRQRLRHCIELELRKLVGAREMADEIPLILEALGQRSPGLTDE